MKLIVLTNLTGPDFNLVAGDITERFDAADAQKLIAYGNAREVIETAPSATDGAIEEPTTKPAKSGRRPRA